MATASFTLNAAGWTSLGAGPIEVQLQGSVPVLIAFNASTPNVGDPSEIVSPSDGLKTREFNIALQAWGMCAPGEPNTSVAVTPLETEGGSGGGDAVTSIDGGLVTLGTTTDAAATNATSAWSAIALLKWIGASCAAVLTKLNAGIGVTGTFWQPTQPVSLASIPALPSGANVIGKFGIDQTTPGTTNGVMVNNTSLAVSGTFWQATQPVSFSGQTVGLSGSLPAFAATPTVNLGTLNGAATSVLQSSIVTALGSPLQAGGNVAVTSLPALPAGANAIGSVTANAGTNLNTSALALESGGNLAAVATAMGAQADTAYVSGSGSLVALLKGIFGKLSNALGTSAASAAYVDGWDATQGAKADSTYAGAGSASVVSVLKGLYASMAAATPAGANIIGKVGIDQTTPGTTNGVVVNSSALPTGAAADGTDSSIATMPAAGVGIRGWLSGIYARLTGTLSVMFSDAVYGSGSTVSASNSAFSGSLGSFSTAGFGSWKITCTTAGSGTAIAWQGSNDGGVTWEPVTASRQDSTNVPPAQSMTSPAVGVVIDIPCTHALMRLYCTALSVAPVFSWCFKAAGPSRIAVDQGAANTYGTAWPFQLKPQTSGGVPTSTVIVGAATTNAGNIKATGGQVYAIDLSNNAATWAYFRLYNLSTAPTVGSSAVVAEYGVAPGASRTISFADLGLPFAAGIAYSITAGAALNDTTALTAASTFVATVHSD